ncbi:MAG TPA: hypothetical protein DCY55_11580 [Gammaproteobacteria bacterium]|jgi:hypothetical protein|nr:hypothetical protein [Gammaproteobacteria bacterium]
MKLKSFVITLVAAQALSFAAWAHHSHGAYAMTDYTEMEGTVTDVYWINPHAWVYLDVLGENGETVNWAFEAAGSTTLVRAGIDPEGVKAGDKIHVKCHPLTDGSSGCLLGFVTTSDGATIEWD